MRAAWTSAPPPLPPLQLRGRSHPIDIYCVPLPSRVQLNAERVAA